MDTSKIINALGGNKAVAEICGISESAVSQWKTSKSGIPRHWLLYFKEKYKRVFRELKENPCDT
jgi:predicted transcriptional regulator